MITSAAVSTAEKRPPPHTHKMIYYRIHGHFSHVAFYFRFRKANWCMEVSSVTLVGGGERAVYLVEPLKLTPSPSRCLERETPLKSAWFCVLVLSGGGVMGLHTHTHTHTLTHS